MILFLFFSNRYSFVLIKECIVRCTECDTITHCFQIWTKLIISICDWFENNYVEKTDSSTIETVQLLKLVLMFVVYLNYQYIFDCFLEFLMSVSIIIWCQLLNRGNFVFKDGNGVNFTTILLQFVAFSNKRENRYFIYLFWIYCCV